MPPEAHCGQYLGYSQAYQDSCIAKFEKTKPTNSSGFSCSGQQQEDYYKVSLVFFSTSSLCG